VAHTARTDDGQARRHRVTIEVLAERIGAELAGVRSIRVDAVAERVTEGGPVQGLHNAHHGVGQRLWPCYSASRTGTNAVRSASARERPPTVLCPGGGRTERLSDLTVLATSATS